MAVINVTVKMKMTDILGGDDSKFRIQYWTLSYVHYYTQIY